MNKIPVLIALFFAAHCLCNAQTPTASVPPGALETMTKFVDLNSRHALQTDEARALFSGEETAAWTFDWIGGPVSLPDRIVSTRPDHSVARVHLVDTDGRDVDLYFYMRFENGWKVTAMRSLAQTGFSKAVIAELKGKSTLTPQEKSELANAELVLSSDKQLTAWFQTNRVSLKAIADLALLETKPKPPAKHPAPPKSRASNRGSSVVEMMAVPEESDGPNIIATVTADGTKFPRSAAALKRLDLAAAEVRSDGSVQIVIGGMTDNTVGFIYSPKETPPRIDGWRYIWVEKVSANWYLVRTT